MKKIIFLQQIGTIDPMILLDLRIELTKYFGNNIISIKSSNEEISLDEFEFDTNTMKYNGSEILDGLANHFDKTKFLCIIGIIDADIKSKKRNYVFGITRTKNRLSLVDDGFLDRPRLALISLYRLRESFYLRPENKTLFKERLFKITIHEIGHQLGLKKCENDCIMKCKHTITEVDEKSSQFCEKCNEYLHSLFRHLKKY